MTDSFQNEQKHFVKDYSGELSFSIKLMFIQDGNALFCSLINLLPNYWRYLYPDSQSHGIQKIFFSTDSQHPHSLKTQEKFQNGYGLQFILKGLGTRKPKDFK